MSPVHFDAPDGRFVLIRNAELVDGALEPCPACGAPAELRVVIRESRSFTPGDPEDVIPVCGRCTLAALAVRIASTLADADLAELGKALIPEREEPER